MLDITPKDSYDETSQSVVDLYFFLHTCSRSELHFESAFKAGEIPQIPLALLQDSNGFIWVGTTDGVYRYDGNEVIEFRHDPLDTATISNNFIQSIHEDRQGNIWLGTRSGLNCYNPRQETIHRHIQKVSNQNTDENFIHSILEDHKGRIWYGTYNGLFQLNPKTQELQQFLPEIERENTLTNKLVWFVFEDMQQRIWVATHEGFTIFKNDETYKFIPYYGDLSKPTGFKN